MIRSTLEAYIIANGIEADEIGVTNQDGKAYFTQLPTGLYLTVVDQAVNGDLFCDFDSALVALPGISQDGYWEYQVQVNAKGKPSDPIDPDKEIQKKVLKLWKGDNDTSERPKSVEIEIFRDGISVETVILSENNHWSYSWSAKDDGANWTVVERNVPQGYTMTVEERDNSFVLTNTRESGDPDTPPPQTGDRSMIHILITAIAGCLLIVVGVVGKRKRL